MLLLIVGGAALYVGYEALKPPENLVTGNVVRQPIIITETEEQLEITDRNNADIREQLRVRLREGDVQIATVREYYFTIQQLVQNQPAKLFVGAPLFFDSIGSTMPPELLRNIADRFMYGIFSLDGNEGFIILQPTSLTIAFASMLNWEDNDLVRDIAPILTPRQLTQDDIFAEFSDALISNQNVRIAKNPQGKEVLLYSLTSQNKLVITHDTNIAKQADRIISLHDGRIVK